MDLQSVVYVCGMAAEASDHPLDDQRPCPSYFPSLLHFPMLEPVQRPLSLLCSRPLPARNLFQDLSDSARLGLRYDLSHCLWKWRGAFSVPFAVPFPKHSWIGIAVLVAIGGLILWPIAGLAAPADLSPARNESLPVAANPGNSSRRLFSRVGRIQPGCFR